jgi:hypothetical protein
MSQFPLIDLPLKHIQTFIANPIGIVPFPNGETLLNFAGQPLITKLDANLAVVWNKDIQHPDFVNSKLSAAIDGSMMAIVGTTEIQLLDAAASLLHSIYHLPWTRFPGAACYFARDNKTIWYILPGDENGNDELQVMSATTFELIAAYPLSESQRYTYIFHATPDNDIILLEAAAGQEESTLVQLQLKNSVISLVELPQCDGIMGNFSPSGKEFVMAPHYDGPLKIYSFPEIALVAELEQDKLFEGSKDYPATEPDNINYTACYIEDNTILVLSQFGRLLLLDRKDLRCKAEVMPAGIVFTAHDLQGHPTIDPDDTYDYSSNIINVMAIHEQLLLTTASGELRTYDLPR